ncbi:2,3-dihydroxybenzoate decarboxylase [Cladophialophora carrionii]|uniref:2,3-dihydroxybenzoate decarboxylase n=1 Tax=Cladophialophora carrionii TaxID=86049 RepID=A0A1C1CFR8_9EURO|nr:2,3-dihydroxybenzoate decarboxylase [Cladophialophora carrionii]
MVPPLITLEEHFFSTAMLTGSTSSYSEQLKHLPGLSEKLADLGDLRLQSMEAGKVSLQIISHAPGPMSADQCRTANDQLAEAVKSHPDRFLGFAVLPVSDPAACPGELSRCIRELGFVGALIDNHASKDGSSPVYYDNAEYFPLWQMAQDLDVPIYLHPTWPTDSMLDLLYTGPDIPLAASKSISSSGFGWHSDVATHILRLFAAGLFDRLPGLKIIIGHMGEMLPFMLERIYQLSPRWGPRQRPFKQVWDENVWITTSGDWSVNPMACILRNTRVERVLYSVDYPFARNEDGLKFMHELEASGLVAPDQLELIAYRNAEKLLGVKHKRRWD